MEEMKRIIQMRVPRTLIGINALEQVGVVTKEFGAKKVLIITDPGVVKAGLIEGVKASLQKAAVDFIVFDESPISAPISAVKEVSKCILDNGIELVIGIGGGSVLDLAKVGVSVAAHHGDTSIIYNANKINKTGVPIICLPTTAGTGSEVSCAAVVTDETNNRKVPVKSDYLWPNVAIIDPTLSLNLPASITADTGADALCHGIESYTSLRANVIADAFAEKAIQLVAQNLRLAYARGSQHLEARYNMAVAAAFGILASRSSAGYIVHSLSYPLGIKAHLGHGRACALMLPYVMEFNLMGNMERFAKIARLMGEPVEELPISEQAKRSVIAVRNLTKDIGLPQRLGEVGIKQEDIPEIVDYVFKYHGYQIETNPRDVAREDLTRILEGAL